MRNHEAVAKIEEEKFESDWRHEVIITDSHVEFKGKLMEVLSKFQSI